MQITFTIFRYKINIPVGALVTLAILALAVLLGVNVGKNVRFLLIFLAAAAVIVFLLFFDVRSIVYLLALTWWFPASLDRFFPLAGMFGPFFRDITLPEALAYVGVVLVLLTARQRATRVLQDPVFIFLALLLIGGLITSENIQTVEGMAIFRRSTFYLFAIVVVCKAFLTNAEISKRVLFLTFLSSVLFLAMILFIQLAVPSLWQPGQAYVNSSRIGGIYTLPLVGSFYFGPNNVGLITNVISVMALAYLLLEPLSGFQRVILAAALVLNFSVLVFTGSRASILSAIIVTGILVVYLFFIKSNFWAVFYALVILLVFAIAISGFINAEIMDRIQNLVAFENDPYGSFPVRLRLIEYGLALFTENPFGIGYGTFVTLTSNTTLWEQNLFLNTTLGAGFLGLIGLLGFFALLFIRAAYKLLTKKRALYIYPLVGTVSFFLNSFLTDPNSETAVYLSWLVLGFAFAVVSLPAQAEQVNGKTSLASR